MLGNSAEEGIVIKKELVSQILEYAPNKLLLHLQPKDLMLVEDWKATKIIKDPRSGNRLKQWLCPMPGFDLEEFPFIICSGTESYNILNLKTYYMQAFIDTPAPCH